MSSSQVFRMGSPREPVFNSIQARSSASWTFTSGILPRLVDGSLCGQTVLEQAAVIRNHLTSIMSRAQVGAEQLVFVEMYWVTAAVETSELEAIVRTVIPAGARPSIRCAGVVALNSRGLMIEVAFTFHEETMINPDDVPQMPDTLTTTARWAGELLLVGGQSDSLGRGATMAERYSNVLDKILVTVRAHGLDASNIVQTTTYVLDEPQSDDFRSIGEVRRAKLSIDSPPVGTMIRVAGLANLDSRVAISAMAVQGGSGSGVEHRSDGLPPTF